MGIRHLNSDAHVDEILEILEEDAGVIIDNVLTKDQLKQYHPRHRSFLRKHKGRKRRIYRLQNQASGSLDGPIARMQEFSA